MLVRCGLWIALFATATSGTLPYAHAGATPTIEAVAACMASAAADLHFNGTAFARVDGVAMQRSFGTSDADERSAIGPDTRFDLASAGKIISAVAVGVLVDRGLVRFEASIGDYLPDLDPAFRPITIAQLLNHTSGLGNYLQPGNLRVISSARTATNLLPLALAATPSFAPGSKRSYSNSGFVVLGAVIERVSGRSFDAFVADEVLRPLGMRDTGFDAIDRATPMTSSAPDGTSATLRPPPLASLNGSPAGGMTSTAADVSRLLSALTDGRLLKPATWAALIEPRPDPGGGPGFYGYGFSVAVRPRLRVGHGGGAPGINAEVALYPASGVQLIVLSNRDPPSATTIVATLEKAVFDDASCASSR